jgi:hypothetical protein
MMLKEALESLTVHDLKRHLALLSGVRAGARKDSLVAALHDTLLS